MPRSFIAIDFPEAVADRLQEIAFGLPHAAWVPPPQYHLTLRFLGEIPETIFEDVVHALHEVRAESFHIDLKGVGHFPLRGSPEILWAGVAASEELVRLNRKLESALKHAGIEPEGRKFHPHVTLARLKNGSARHLGNFEVHHSLFKVCDIPVEGLNLYSSRLTPEGAIHTLEARYSLNGMLQGYGDENEEDSGMNDTQDIREAPREAPRETKEVA